MQRKSGREWEQVHRTHAHSLNLSSNLSCISKPPRKEGTFILKHSSFTPSIPKVQKKVKSKLKDFPSSDDGS